MIFVQNDYKNCTRVVGKGEVRAQVGGPGSWFLPLCSILEENSVVLWPHSLNPKITFSIGLFASVAKIARRNASWTRDVIHKRALSPADLF